MKLTTENLRRIIKEELEQLFNNDTGDINEDVLEKLYMSAANGNKEAQENLWHASDVLKSRVGLNYSPGDGTPMNKKAIAQKYGLDPKTGKPLAKKQAPQEPQMQQKAPTKSKSQKQKGRDDFMAKAIKSKMMELDPEDEADIKEFNRLKMAMKMFQGDQDE